MMDSIIKTAYEQNCHFMQAGILDEVMNTIHSESLSFSQTEQMLEQLISNYQLTVNLKAFKYMGKDKTYAYARAQQEVTKISGPEFRNNNTDQLIVFKQDGDEWKIWTTAILNIQYLDD